MLQVSKDRRQNSYRHTGRNVLEPYACNISAPPPALAVMLLGHFRPLGTPVASCAGIWIGLAGNHLEAVPRVWLADDALDLAYIEYPLKDGHVGRCVS